MEHVRSVCLGVWFLSGARWERQEENGISHLIEHMLFRGTSRREAAEIAREVESLGGSLDAFTGKELTCYYGRTLGEHLPIVIDVISDIIMNSLFREDDLVRERQVILEEIKSFLDSPDERAFDILFRCVFQGHPLEKPVLGTIENVSRFSSSDIIAHMKRVYTNSRVVVAASGNVIHQELVDLIEGSLKLPRSGNMLEDCPCTVTSGGIVEFLPRNDISQVHLSLGTCLFPYSDERRYPLMLLNTVIGRGMSSRLFQRVREREGLVYEISSFIEMFSDSGLFSIYLATSPEQCLQALASVMDELVRFLQDGLVGEQLEQAKSQVEGGLTLTLESTSQRMLQLGKSEVYLGTYIPLDETIARIKAVTIDDVVDVARVVLDPKGMNLSLVGPLTDSQVNEFRDEAGRWRV
jgi:predicted Zn-dependent peptidase